MNIKCLYLLLFCVITGCTTTDQPTIALLINRMDKLEKQVKIENKTEITPALPKNLLNPTPNKLNDAQKDFVGYVLDYLGEKP